MGTYYIQDREGGAGHDTVPTDTAAPSDRGLKVRVVSPEVDFAVKAAQPALLVLFVFGVVYGGIQFLKVRLRCVCIGLRGVWGGGGGGQGGGEGRGPPHGEALSALSCHQNRLLADDNEILTPDENSRY
jgi:hypothetical protein